MINYKETPVDRAFHALADPTRLLMVERLTHRPHSVGELAEPLEMSLPGVLQHLRILEKYGLVRSRKVGRVRTCYLDGRALGQVERWISERRTTWERRLDRLGAYLEATAPGNGEER